MLPVYVSCGKENSEIDKKQKNIDINTDIEVSFILTKIKAVGNLGIVFE